VTAGLILAASIKFIVWEAALFAASMRVARLVGWGKDREAAEQWLAVVAIDVVMESSCAGLFSFLGWNSAAGYWVVGLAAAASAVAGRRRPAQSWGPAPQLPALFLSALAAPLVLLAFKPVEEIDSINYLHYLLDWMGNRANPFTFATNYVAFWELSFLPTWTITRVDLFFPLLALKSVVLVALGAWLVGRELGISRDLLLGAVAAALAMRHYWFGPSGVPTLKNDVLHGAGFLLLALVMMRRARGPLARTDVALLSLGAAFATVKYTGVFLAGICLIALWRVALWPVLLCLVTSGPYYLNGLLRHGSPFYPFQINLGPLHLPGTADLSYTSILYSLRDPLTWRLLFLPEHGLSPAGLLFPVTLAAILVVASWFAVRGAWRRLTIGEQADSLPHILAFLILCGWLLYFRSVFSASAGMGDLAFLRNGLNTIRYVDGVLAASELFLVWLIGRWAWPFVVLSLGSRLVMLYDQIPSHVFPALMVVASSVLVVAALVAGRRRAVVVCSVVLTIAAPLLVERNRIGWTVYWNDLKPALAGVRSEGLAYLGLEDGGYFAGHVVAAGNPVDSTVRCLSPQEFDMLPAYARPKYLALMVTPGSEVGRTWRDRYGARVAGWGYQVTAEGAYGALYARR